MLCLKFKYSTIGLALKRSEDDDVQCKCTICTRYEVRCTMYNVPYVQDTQYNEL